MQLFAGFFFDGRGIGLELPDALGVPRILFLQAVNLGLQGLHLGALLAVDDDSIRSEHGVQNDSANQQRRQHYSQPSPFPRQPRPGGTRLLHPACRQSFRSRGLLHDHAEPVLGTRQDSNP